LGEIERARVGGNEQLKLILIYTVLHTFHIIKNPGREGLFTPGFSYEHYLSPIRRGIYFCKTGGKIIFIAHNIMLLKINILKKRHAQRGVIHTGNGE
jgi:hypothetical protein